MKRYEKGQEEVAYAIFIFLFVFVIFLCSFRGVFVSRDKATAAASAQLGAQVELGPKHVWFNHWRGCEKGTAAMFKVLPYTNSQGVLVSNAIVCSGWPFKGITIRFR